MKRAICEIALPLTLGLAALIYGIGLSNAESHTRIQDCNTFSTKITNTEDNRLVYNAGIYVLAALGLSYSASKYMKKRI